MLSAPRLFAESPGHAAGSGMGAWFEVCARAAPDHNTKVSADRLEQVRKSGFTPRSLRALAKRPRLVGSGSRRELGFVRRTFTVFA